MDIDREYALRAHIRKLLLHYSLTHLTIDYVTHTQTEVSELLSDCLDAVPVDDPTSLVLPVDPYEALCKTLGIKDQRPYDQTWRIADESRQYISNVLLKSQSTELPTSRCWSSETQETCTYRPMTPILTTRAIRQTPRIGASSSSLLPRSFSRCDSKYLKHFKIRGVADEPVDELVFSSRERDQILNIHPTLDKETFADLSSLTACPSDAQHQSKSPSDRLASMVAQFLHNDTSLPLKFPCPMSPPIFPRRLETSWPGVEVSDIHSLGFLVPVEIKDEEVDDISKAHMLIVDGWSVMAPPPTSQGASSNTPSLEAASQSSQMEVDELFSLTPPQQLLTGLTEDKKMEEYLIPRSHKPGGGGKERLNEPKQSLATFLPQLLPPVSVKTEPSMPDITLHPSPPVSLSILGHPPTPTKSSVTNQSTVDRFVESENFPLDVGLDSLISQLCAPVDGESAEDIITRENIDEKDALMMEVPKLKDPYLHPSTPSFPVLPTSVRSLVSSKKPTPSGVAMDPQLRSMHLKKVTGVQSLNIELTWRPFNFGTSMPRTEELTDVDHYPTLNSQSDLNMVDHDAENELKTLLASTESGIGAEEFRGVDLCDDPSIDRIASQSEDWGRYDVVLTRAERRRVSGHQQTCHYDKADVEIKNQTFEDSSGSEENTSPTRPYKRRKVVSTSGTISNSEVQRDMKCVPDLDSARFSFNTLCSPEQDVYSQPLSEDAPYWNYADDAVDAENSQVGGSKFLDYHSDPIWTAEAAAQSLDGHYAYVTTDSAGTVLGGQTSTPQMAQDLYLRKESPPQSPDLVLPNHITNLSSVAVVPESATRPSNAHRLEKVAAQEALSNFMKLRGKAAHETIAIPALQPEPEPEPSVDRVSSPRSVPTELTDANTLGLPDEWIPPSSRHRYIASLDVLQKTVLLKRLASFDCNVELVERDNCGTNGPDLIVDVDTALLFVPLAPLPVSGEALAERVAKLSWDFGCLVLVFEAFSTSLLYRSDKNGSETLLTPYAFPPAVVKALRKFKRMLAIMDGMVTETKRRDIQVRYAYARDVGEAARFARLVGDMTEKASAAATWNSRDWLTDDYHEDETDLAQIKGMNVYAAALILRYVDFDTFIDLEPGNRVEMFSSIIGAQRITMFNEEITNRLTCIAMSTSPLLSPTAQSITSSNKPIPEAFEDNSCYGDGYIEIAGEREDLKYHHAGQSVWEDGDIMDWQATGLLMIPGKGQCTDALNHSI